jgi:hypothetical protein
MIKNAEGGILSCISEWSNRISVVCEAMTKVGAPLVFLGALVAWWLFS